MKRLTASEVRRDWFRVLDEVAAGEVVVVERKGRRVVLRRADDAALEAQEASPDYSELLDARDVDNADRWGWDWDGAELVAADADRS